MEMDKFNELGWEWMVSSGANVRLLVSEVRFYVHKWCHRIFIYYPIKNNGYSDYYVSKYMYIAVLWNVYIIQGSDVPKLPCVAMETVSMHIDTVVLYVYQYCRSIDTGNVITIHIKTADIVILVTISSHSYYLKTSQSTDGHVTSNYVLSHSILHAFSLNF